MFLDFYNDVSKVEFPVALGFTLFTFWQIWNMPHFGIKSARPGWYTTAANSANILPSGVRLFLRNPWIFGLAWTVIYSLISASIFLYWRDYNSTQTKYYGWVLLMYLINIILNKFWSPIFFGTGDVKSASMLQSMFVFAFIDLLLVFGTGVAYVVLVALDGAWLAFGLWMPYLAWLLIALVLNGYMAWEAVNLV
jgi:tryptophan-rich sensory protein